MANFEIMKCCICGHRFETVTGPLPFAMMVRCPECDRYRWVPRQDYENRPPESFPKCPDCEIPFQPDLDPMCPACGSRDTQSIEITGFMD